MGEDAARPRSMGRLLRPLLPADEEVAARASAARSNPPGAQRRVAVACEACRRRKAKCDGARPGCTSCSSRGVSCVYASDVQGESHSQALKRKLDELYAQYTAYKEVYENLQYRPVEEAEEIIRRIRTGESPESVLEHVHGGELLLQLALN